MRQQAFFSLQNDFLLMIHTVEAKMPQVQIEKTNQLIARARTLLMRNQLVEAAQCFFEITQLDPHCFEALGQLGTLLSRFSRFDEALFCLLKAKELNPKFPKLNLLIGSVLKNLNRFEDAAAYCRSEIQLNPADPDAHYNLGLVLQSLDRLQDAASSYETALKLRPGYVDALMRLGSVFRDQLDVPRARRCFDEAVLRAPENPEAHWELAVTLLLCGQFAQGWNEFDWRWKLKDFSTPQARFKEPQWDGSPLNGRSIFLHPEQGFGDVIQFARYAPMVAERGGRVILGCPRSLRRLMESLPGVDLVVTNPIEAGGFDVHAPLMSLPRIFGTTLETVPANVPYLKKSAVDFELDTRGPGVLKVGVVWAGDPSHRNDRNRSMPALCLKPLLEVPHIEWHSLQVGPARKGLDQSPLKERINDTSARLLDFSDTAQVIQQLDLILSVDTAVAHLAGALGKPVWTMLPFSPEWRWMLDCKDSPWYPTMRLFRQSAPGDWASLIDRVCDALRNLAVIKGEKSKAI